MFKRIMGGVLAAVMLASMLPVTVFAEGETGAPTESQVCAHGNTGDCLSCDAVYAVQAGIETLPGVEEMLAMDNSRRNAVYNSLLDVTEGYELLSAEDRALVSGLDSMTALHEAFTQLVAPVSANSVAIDEDNFPDPVFRAYVGNTFDSDGDGSLSYEEYALVLDIHVDRMRIASLAGIASFPNLKTLSCSGNQLTELDVSRNPALEALWCGVNQLTELDVSHNPALQELECAHNQLPQLDVSQNPALWLLYCGSNHLTELNLQNNPALTDLHCGMNQLKELDVSSNPALRSLHCNSNQLTSLDLSQNPDLTERVDHANSYEVETNDRQFDLSTLPGTFDVESAGNWAGGSISGNTLTVDAGVSTVTYTYQNTPFTFTVSEAGRDTYTLTFDSNGGPNAAAAVRVPKNSNYEITPEVFPSREGYRFLGWSADKNAAVPEYKEEENCTIKVGRSMVLYAVWEAEDPYHTLTLDANDGTGLQELIRVDAGRDCRITAALCPSREGYALVGWSEDPGSTAAAIAADGIVKLSSDMTLYAVWHVAAQAPAEAADVPQASGQTDSLDEPCEEHKYSNSSGAFCLSCGQKYEPVKEAYPKVMKTAKKDTELRDAPNSDTSQVTDVLSKGKEVIISHKLANAAGDAWFLTVDGHYIDGESLTEVPGKCALVFDANGGTGGPKSSANNPNTVKLPPRAEPTREGYLFKGWAYRKDATYPEWIYDDLKKGNEITLKGDTIFYAVWAKPNTPVSVDYITQDKLNKAVGFPQVRGLNPNKSENEGLCTSSATALLIKRKQIVDGYEGELFDFTDVRMSLGVYENKGVKGYYNYGVKFEEGTEADMWKRPFDGYWTQATGFTNLHSQADEAQRTTYYTAGKSVKQLGRSVDEIKKSIIKILAEHPEGVVVYSRYGGGLSHAIVLTGYDEKEGFYACDPVNVRDAYTEDWTDYTKSDTQTLLEETWLYSEIKQGVFGNLSDCGDAGCLWYIESVSHPTP